MREEEMKQRTAPREPVSPGESLRVFEWPVAGSGD